MTLSLSEFHNSLRNLDSMVTVATLNPSNPDWIEAVRICAENVGHHALYMMGRRQCSVTGDYYFLDSAEKEFSLILKLGEEIADAFGTDDNSGTSGEKQQVPYLLRKPE